MDLLNMATLKQIQELLDSKFFTISQEKEDSFWIKYNSRESYILKSEIDDYLKVKDSISNADFETSISYPGYYEHLVDINPYDIYLLSKALKDGNEFKIFFSQDEKISLKISFISSTYLLFLLQKINPRKTFRYRRLIGTNYYISPSEIDLHWSRIIFKNLLTLQISTSVDSTYHNDNKKLYRIAESSLFNFSYGTGISLNLSRKWERTRYTLNRRNDTEIQLFPRRTYESNLISYYQLAISSNSLMFSYVSLYKIIEHFFITSAEKDLHDKMKEKLVQPLFSHTKPSQLRELASLIRKYDQKSDEIKMLNAVIKQYFNIDELINWVNTHETLSAYYTNTQKIFGKDFKLDLNPEQLISTITNRIYHIRNALVHNKEGELPRFVPFSGEEDVLSKEIFLILFLSEELILKTGKDI
jgi:hypothetical protein